MIILSGGGACYGGRERGGQEVLRVGLPDQAPADAVSGASLVGRMVDIDGMVDVYGFVGWARWG